MHVQQHLGHGAARVGERVLDVEPQAVEYDAPCQGVPVGVQSVRRVADQHVARPHQVTVQGGGFLHHADDRPGQIVLPRLVQVRKLGGLAAGEDHVVRAAAARHARHDRRGRLGLELGGREVVEERERTGAVHQDIIHAMVHEVLAHGVVDPSTRRHQHFRADSVGREDQRRAVVPGRHSDHPAERADFPERQRRARRPHQRRNAALRVVGSIEPHTGRGVAVGHPGGASSMSKCTRSLNARTRACTSAGVTCSSPCTPKASTANEPIAAP